MAPASHRSEELDFDFVLNIIFTQVARTYLNLIPAERSSFRAFDLRLVNWSVLAERDHSVNYEKTEFAIVQLSNGIELDYLRVRGGFLLLSLDYDAASFACAHGLIL